MPYQQWEQQYAFLHKRQLKDPIWVIHACAMGDSIYNDREHLFDIFYAALGSKAFQDYNAKAMRDYVYCWERVISMIESCHRLSELMFKEQFHYSYSGDVVPK
jgi:hypothetical protein